MTGGRVRRKEGDYLNREGVDVKLFHEFIE
jgi:hypothetical protein